MKVDLITLKEYVTQEKVFVTGHRGSSGTAPENTLSAFRHAVESGAKMVESDIQLTADNQIIAFHDFNLGRTTKGIADTSSLTYEEISKLDAGSWFGDEFANERVPLLSDVIDLINNKTYLNIELKSKNNLGVEKYIETVIDLIYSKGYEKYTLFASFNYKLLKKLNEIDPNLPTAAIRIPGDKRLPSELSKLYGAKAFVCSKSEINPTVSDDLEHNNIFAGVYPIDSEAELETVLNYHIKTVVSNYPKKIVELLNKKL